MYILLFKPTSTTSTWILDCLSLLLLLYSTCILYCLSLLLLLAHVYYIV